MQGVITMSYERVLASFLVALALSVTAEVAAKDDNQQQQGPFPAASKTFQPAVAQMLNRMFAQHLCQAIKPRNSTLHLS